MGSLMKRQLSELNGADKVVRAAMTPTGLTASARLGSRGADGIGQHDDGQPAVGVPGVAAAIASRAL